MNEITLTRPRYQFTRRGVLSFLGVLIIFGCATLPRYFHAQKSAQWPTVPGMITVSQLKVGYLKHMKGYFGDVEYSYRVGATDYHGNRLSFNRVHLGVKDAWQRVLDSYPVGKVVAVYYDPADPELSVLEPGLHGEMESIFKLDLLFVGSFAVTFLLVLLAPRHGAKI